MKKPPEDDPADSWQGDSANVFDVFINARGQRLLKTMNLPFPRLRGQLQSAGIDIPEVGDDYMLAAPEFTHGRIAFGALPYPLHNRPFVQDTTASAKICSHCEGGIATGVTHTRLISLYGTSLFPRSDNSPECVTPPASSHRFRTDPCFSMSFLL